MTTSRDVLASSPNICPGQISWDCHANDPYEEHDFGSFEADGHMIMFKIDYLDQALTYHSPDPADPAVTQRVITIMLAEEY